MTQELYFIKEGHTFFYLLLGYDYNVTITRLFVICFFMIFGSHAQFTINLLKKTEDALSESEKKYRTILENVEDGYYELDASGKFTFFNDSLSKILGYPKDEIKEMNIRQSLDDKDAEKVTESISNVFETGEPIKTAEWKLI